MKKIIDWYLKLLNTMVTIIMWGLLLVVFTQVAGRYLPFIPRWLWPQELASFGLIWLVFVGSAVAVKEKRHFFIDLFPESTPRTLQLFLVGIYYFVMIVTTVIFVVFGYEFATRWGGIQRSSVTGINLFWLYVSVPFAGLSWTFFLISDLWELRVSANKKISPEPESKEGVK